MEKKKDLKGMKYAILSLSLLTVMAGAAVAPALGAISEHFSGENGTLVQLIISMPSLFIFLASFVFPKLCRKIGSRTLVMMGLALYVIGGCGAAFFDNIYVILIFRALVGMGVGLIMPLSTGLLTYYYPPEELDGLMGLSSAMNQMGGAVATFIAGLLAVVSWRASFMVYLMGLISVVLCLGWLPNEMIVRDSSAEADAKAEEDKNAAGKGSNLKKYFVYVAAMFILMSTFFIYPSNFALEAGRDGALSQQAIATVMAIMDVVAFAGGLCFVIIKGKLKENAHFAAPILFFAGYLILALTHNAAGSVIGSFLIGFANGVGIPCIIASASKKAGRDAVSTVMPLLSAAMYMGQFLSPFIMSLINAVLENVVQVHLSFWFAAVLAAALALIASRLRKAELNK